MCKRQTCIILIMFAAVFFSGCTMWHARDWNSLTDRKFYFTRFEYVHRNAGRKKAMEFMKDFPLRKTLDLMEEKYGIGIDSEMFEQFLEKGDPETIKETGFFQGNTYTWKDTVKRGHSVDLNFMLDFDAYEEEREGHEYSIKITVKTGWKSRAVYIVLKKSREEAMKALNEQLEKE